MEEYGNIPDQGSVDLSGSWTHQTIYWINVGDEAIYMEKPLDCFKAYRIALSTIEFLMKEEEKKRFKEFMKKVEGDANKYRNYERIFNGKGVWNPPREVFDMLYEWKIKIMDKLKPYLLGE